VRFQQHRDVSCHQVVFPARQGVEGNARHSARNISLLPSWSDKGLISTPVLKYADTRQPTRGCPPALGLTERITTPHAKKLICYKVLHKALNLGQVLWKESSPGMPATIRSRTFRLPACYLSTQKLKYDLYGRGFSKKGC